MILQRTETGKWMLLEMNDEDVSTLYFASSDYASTLQRELATRRIAGKAISEQDVEFLADAAPKAERVWDRYSDATEDILEKAGLI